MDFFRKQVEAAQAQARLAASTAGKLAEQLTDQTKVLAEQASTFGKATAEQVGSTAPEARLQVQHGQICKTAGLVASQTLCLQCQPLALNATTTLSLHKSCAKHAYAACPGPDHIINIRHGQHGLAWLGLGGPVQRATSVLTDSQQTATANLAWLLRRNTEHHLSWNRVELAQTFPPWQTCCWPLPAPSSLVICDAGRAAF